MTLQQRERERSDVTVERERKRSDVTVERLVTWNDTQDWLIQIGIAIIKRSETS